MCVQCAYQGHVLMWHLVLSGHHFPQRSPVLVLSIVFESFGEFTCLV